MRSNPVADLLDMLRGKRPVSLAGIAISASFFVLSLACVLCVLVWGFAPRRSTERTPGLPEIPTRTPRPTVAPSPVPSEEMVTIAPTETVAPTEPASPTQYTEPPCECTENLYNCDDFSSDQEAQECYLYCVEEGAGDVHDLDRDGDERACEWKE